jgi:predicted nuclease with TOPRIM domain
LGRGHFEKKKKEEAANLQRIKALEAELAQEQAAVKRHREESFRKISERRRRQVKLAKRRSRFKELLFFQFKDCFELPLRQAAPRLCETDIEWTLYTMFENMPDWMAPSGQ